MNNEGWNNDRGGQGRRGRGRGTFRGVHGTGGGGERELRPPRHIINQPTTRQPNAFGRDPIDAPVMGQPHQQYNTEQARMGQTHPINVAYGGPQSARPPFEAPMMGQAHQQYNNEPARMGYTHPMNTAYGGPQPLRPQPQNGSRHPSEQGYAGEASYVRQPMMGQSHPQQPPVLGREYSEPSQRQTGGRRPTSAYEREYRAEDQEGPSQPRMRAPRGGDIPPPKDKGKQRAYVEDIKPPQVKEESNARLNERLRNANVTATVDEPIRNEETEMLVNELLMRLEAALNENQFLRSANAILRKTRKREASPDDDTSEGQRPSKRRDIVPMETDEVTTRVSTRKIHRAPAQALAKESGGATYAAAVNRLPEGPNPSAMHNRDRFRVVQPQARPSAVNVVDPPPRGPVLPYDEDVQMAAEPEERGYEPPVTVRMPLAFPPRTGERDPTLETASYSDDDDDDDDDDGANDRRTAKIAKHERQTPGRIPDGLGIVRIGPAHSIERNNALLGLWPRTRIYHSTRTNRVFAGRSAATASSYEASNLDGYRPPHGHALYSLAPRGIPLTIYEMDRLMAMVVNARMDPIARSEAYTLLHEFGIAISRIHPDLWDRTMRAFAASGFDRSYQPDVDPSVLDTPEIERDWTGVYVGRLNNPTRGAGTKAPTQEQLMDQNVTGLWAILHGRPGSANHLLGIVMDYAARINRRSLFGYGLARMMCPSDSNTRLVFMRFAAVIFASTNMYRDAVAAYNAEHLDHPMIPQQGPTMQFRRMRLDQRFARNMTISDVITVFVDNRIPVEWIDHGYVFGLQFMNQHYMGLEIDETLWGLYDDERLYRLEEYGVPPAIAAWDGEREPTEVEHLRLTVMQSVDEERGLRDSFLGRGWFRVGESPFRTYLEMRSPVVAQHGLAAYRQQMVSRRARQQLAPDHSMPSASSSAHMISTANTVEGASAFANTNATPTLEVQDDSTMAGTSDPSSITFATQPDTEMGNNTYYPPLPQEG
jgi:hypothetical protein